MSKEQMNPVFKEKIKGRNEQYIYTDGKWEKTTENVIVKLWNKWVIAKGAIRIRDERGFIIYGYKNQ